MDVFLAFSHGVHRGLLKSVKFDDRLNQKPGFKFNEHEIKGVPIRIAIGPRDLKENTLEIFEEI